MNKDLKSSIRMASASIATVLACVVMPMLAPGDQSHAPILFVIFAIIAVCAGWLFILFKLRLLGLLHAILMLVVGGYFLSVGLPYFVAAPGKGDNPAAGAIGFANLVVVAVGIITLGAGVAVMSFGLSLEKKGGDSEGRY